MKKKARIILIVIASIVLLGCIFGIVDYFRAKNNKSPIFAISVIKYKDGSSVEYWGLGYKVIKCVKMIHFCNPSSNCNTPEQLKSVYLGFYTLNIDVCNTTFENTTEENITDIAFNYLAKETQNLIINKDNPNIKILEANDYEKLICANNVEIKDKKIYTVEFFRDFAGLPNNTIVVIDYETKEVLGLPLLD